MSDVGGEEDIVWMSHAGIMTCSVQDTALILDALAEPALKGAKDSYCASLKAHRRLRLGLPRNCPPPGGLSHVYEEAANVLRGLGHKIVVVRRRR